jgi:hypothetical protein
VAAVGVVEPNDMCEFSVCTKFEGVLKIFVKLSELKYDRPPNFEPGVAVVDVGGEPLAPGLPFTTDDLDFVENIFSSIQFISSRSYRN